MDRISSDNCIFYPFTPRNKLRQTPTYEDGLTRGSMSYTIDNYAYLVLPVPSQPNIKILRIRLLHKCSEHPRYRIELDFALYPLSWINPSLKKYSGIPMTVLYSQIPLDL